MFCDGAEKRVDRRGERRPVGGAVDRVERRREIAAHVPPQRIGAPLFGGPIVGRQPRRRRVPVQSDLRDDRTVARLPHLERQRLAAAAHGNVGLDDLDRHPFAAIERPLARRRRCARARDPARRRRCWSCPTRCARCDPAPRTARREWSRRSHRDPRRRGASRTTPTGTRSADADRWRESAGPLSSCDGQHPVVAVRATRRRPTAIPGRRAISSRACGAAAGCDDGR